MQSMWCYKEITVQLQKKKKVIVQKEKKPKYNKPLKSVLTYICLDKSTAIFT